MDRRHEKYWNERQTNFEEDADPMYLDEHVMEDEKPFHYHSVHLWG